MLSCVLVDTLWVRFQTQFGFALWATFKTFLPLVWLEKRDVMKPHLLAIEVRLKLTYLVEVWSKICNLLIALWWGHWCSLCHDFRCKKPFLSVFFLWSRRPLVRPLQRIPCIVLHVKSSVHSSRWLCRLYVCRNLFGRCSMTNQWKIAACLIVSIILVYERIRLASVLHLSWCSHLLLDIVQLVVAEENICVSLIMLVHVEIKEAFLLPCLAHQSRSVFRIVHFNLFQ